jgi:hypothetical protein
MNIANLSINRLGKLTARNKIGEGMILYGFVKEIHISNGSEYIVWMDSDEDCKQKFIIRDVIKFEEIK